MSTCESHKIALEEGESCPRCDEVKALLQWVPAVTGTEAAVCADIAKRQALGINKYGTTVAQNPLELRAWLQHAYEEVLDTAVYLKRAIEEIDSNWGDGK